MHAINTDPKARQILDRSQMLGDGFIQSIIDQSVFAWEGRKPKAALDADGNVVETDLDLLSFLVPMMKRRAVIEIPQYRNRRGRVEVEGQRHAGNSQFGKIVNLVSNKDSFSFSARLMDHSVVVRDQDEQEDIGAFRNYMFVDLNGEINDVWRSIVFDPTAAENEFLREFDLWRDGKVEFDHVVHPNRKQSLFGLPYLLLKLLYARINDEISFYKTEQNRLLELGLSLPPRASKQKFKAKKVGQTQATEVEVMQVILDHPEFVGQYQPLPDTVESLHYAYERAHNLTYRIRPRVQFVIRADELAYFKYGMRDSYIAPWVKNVVWEKGFRPYRGRLNWKRLRLSDNYAIRYTVKRKTEHLAA